MFTLTPSGSGDDVIEGNDNVFQVCFTDSNQGTRSAQYIDENFEDPQIAIIYKNDDQYSQGIRDNFVAEAESRGMSIVYEGTFTEASQTDFNNQLTAAQSAGADMIFLPIYYTPASVILTQANAMGYAPTFFGVDGMDGILTAARLRHLPGRGRVPADPLLRRRGGRGHPELRGRVPGALRRDPQPVRRRRL